MASIPIFPLNTVLFPKCKLPLQIFEPRYLDMLSQSLKAGSGFVIALAKSTHQTAIMPKVYCVGTLTQIVDFGQLPNGLLGVTVMGQDKVVIGSGWLEDSGLMVAEVSPLPIEQSISLPKKYQCLAEVLGALLAHPIVAELEVSSNLSNGLIVGWQLANYLPFSLQQKQLLLELNNPLLRLAQISHLLDDMAQAAV
ncbi:LON peptidase substrate-binding domain-containing protein [Endozoicomonas sp. SM1973]|uniref:LON peptidase substrate-binding domain-containing protein n=1 Tax=Spartinivicinus marinus TaxID=2994442 RepID=A0A853I877_9GAMM|nr:LON peptidase substrate-binding domain-containing protein [Spartinivicinus marinus]MCX4026022.1 LON peptidase substrate-binding domain-containing protein [Spartinivicinus marinus]NYZ67922.1 LON peptidase substrate-binding domain-containing protein [Spartinivicinus marinus]